MPAGKKKSEHGSGLYLTTSAATARRYAKGGGSIIRFEIDDRIRWLDRLKITLALAEAFIDGQPRLRHREQVRADLHRYVERTGQDPIPASVLQNLLINHDALTGNHGPALAEFFVAQGADADYTRPPMFGGNPDEEWIILYNLDLIRNWRRVTANESENAPRIRR